MEQHSDQFYVVLMSNNSMEQYPDNVLSSFTNTLPHPLRLEGKWCVGVTHVSYGPFSSFQRMVMAPTEENYPEFGVETFDPITVTRPATPVHEPPYKKKRGHHHKRDREYRTQNQEASNEKKIIIKVSDAHNIVLTHSDLQELTYEKHHLNCGKLLKVLPERIEPKVNDFDPSIFYEREMLKRKIKYEIIDLIKNEDWIIENKIVKHTRKKDEFLMHVYQGSRKSTNIPLQYQKYDNIESFVREIVYQLPVNERKKSSLTELFNLFHSNYDLATEKATIPQKIEMNLYVPLPEYGTSSGIDTKELIKNKPNVMEQGISMEEIIALFRDNLQYKDEKMLSSSEKLELRMKIKNAIVDVLRGNALNGPYMPKHFKKDDLPLNVPVELLQDCSRSKRIHS